MHKIVFENLNTVFLLSYFYHINMGSLRVLCNLIIILFLCTPLAGNALVAQVSNEFAFTEHDFVEYNKLKLRSVETISSSEEPSYPSDLIFSQLTAVENNLANNLNSHWVWSESTLDIIDSFSPFLFRTKKSAAVEEVKILLQVNSLGRLIGFEVQGDVDKGLKERIDYVLRKLPDCKPVPGFDTYGVETFELIIQK
ncbi:hypothetical protein ACPUEN_07900 [Algoriphagus yeomjeoni]|uniref:hypothetical protein n=1 Tax=Algoriphagus yeomjeoni TaxID=291403 RepID=UPI003CE56F15